LNQLQGSRPLADYRYFEDWRAFRILDPACGCGNFLYLALQALKDLEQQPASRPTLLPHVWPETMLGIEINPLAAKLARVSVWFGYIQWTLRHAYAAPSDPVLQPLDPCRWCMIEQILTQISIVTAP
jgi:type II restriction/modification system DNA methylase subunit YeeA